MELQEEDVRPLSNNSSTSYYDYCITDTTPWSSYPFWRFEEELEEGTKLYYSYFSVPLHYFSPTNNNNSKTRQEISIFLRKVTRDENLPYLLYFQGGPGFPTPKPTDTSGWMKRALSKYQILLLDQRGTGSSTAVLSDHLTHLSVEEQVEYLTAFRADSIVEDCEVIRSQLKIDKWALLGQSFGGFIISTYLSFYAESILVVYISGGIPPVFLSNPDRVYMQTFKTVIYYSNKYYSDYPNDVQTIKEICKVILKAKEKNEEIYLGDGSVLSIRKFQQLGLFLGLEGGKEFINSLVKSAFTDEDHTYFTNSFYVNLEEALRLTEEHPLFVILHECIYCQGEPSNWSAQRVMNESYSFIHITSEEQIDQSEFIYFTGEMIFPWMFEEFNELKPFAKAAHSIATKPNWRKLYDIEKLKSNTTPGVAIAFPHDMYVDYQLCKESMKYISNINIWENADYYHNGMQLHGELIFDTLLSMVNNKPTSP